MLQTSARVVLSVSQKKLTFAFSSTRLLSVHCVAVKRCITHYSKRVSERTNRNLPAC